MSCKGRGVRGINMSDLRKYRVKTHMIDSAGGGKGVRRNWEGKLVL